MFSTAQLDIVRGFLDSYGDLGYKYYAVTQYPVQQNNNPYDIVLIVSSEPFDYSLSDSIYDIIVPSGSVVIQIASGNYSSYNQNQRYQIQELTADQHYQLPAYVHLATNCVNSVDLTAVVPDIGGVVYAENQTGGLLFMFTIFIFLFAFLRLFRR